MEGHEAVGLLIEYQIESGLAAAWDVRRGGLELHAFWQDERAILAHEQAILDWLLPRGAPPCTAVAHTWTWLRERKAWHCETCHLMRESGAQDAPYIQAVVLEKSARPVFGTRPPQRKAS